MDVVSKCGTSTSCLCAADMLSAVLRSFSEAKTSPSAQAESLCSDDPLLDSDRLQPFRHTQSGDKQDQADNQEQEEQKLRNSRCRRGDTGKAKDRRDQRNYQKDNCPTQHNNPPFSAYSRVLAILRARSVAAVVGCGAIHNVANSRSKFGPR